MAFERKYATAELAREARAAQNRAWHARHKRMYEIRLPGQISAKMKAVQLREQKAQQLEEHLLSTIPPTPVQAYVYLPPPGAIVRSLLYRVMK